MNTRLINTSFNIIFPRQIQMRRMANKIEDHLQEYYLQPQVVPVPDEMDPEIPRLVFGSRHGFSQILVSQISITLNTVYSPEWQKDNMLGRDYYLERSNLLYSVLPKVGDFQPSFCGLTNTVHISIDGTDEDVISRIATTIPIELHGDGMHDLELKTTKVVNNRFFHNVTVRNYRGWPGLGHPVIERMPRKSAVERGIELVTDFNDRYSFNEFSTYNSSRQVVDTIIESGFAHLGEAINKFGVVK